jgi:hypothetical protein
MSSLSWMMRNTSIISQALPVTLLYLIPSPFLRHCGSSADWIEGLMKLSGGYGFLYSGYKRDYGCPAGDGE